MSHRHGTILFPRLGVPALALVGLGAAAGCPSPPPVEVEPTSFGRALSNSMSLDPRIAAGAPSSTRPVPPIVGGTMHIARGDMLVVSDPPRDRVVFVDLATSRRAGEVALPEGAFPSRITEDAEGRVYVVLRGRGEVLSVDPRRPSEARRHTVCAQPRGIAYDASADVIRVGCRDGFLDTLSTRGELLSRVDLGVDDIRDVVPLNGRLYVTTFRSAEVHAFDGELRPISSTAPSVRHDTATFSGERVDFLPEVAWRTIAVGRSLVMVHQRGAERVVASPSTPAYYGNGFGCGGSVLDSVVTRFEIDEDGTPREGTHFSLMTLGLGGTTLPVDVAVDASNQAYVVAAGEQGSLPSAVAISMAWPGLSIGGECDFAPAEPAYDRGGAVAVVLDRNGRPIFQVADPPEIVVGRTVLDWDGRTHARDATRIALGGESRFDAGHALFHGNAGLGLACASCHPEGGDDGRVWQFPGFPPLRTPAMHGGVASTAPFHWEGDMPTMGALMNEVFERRMGGPPMGPREEAALAGWLDTLPSSTPRTGLDPAAVDRGALLFWGEAQCGNCHNGPMLTDNRNYDVGTGMSLQVPSLVGVSYRLPVMHNGCAKTLRQRFDPACGGGDRHGRTSHLSEAQLADLVAYLQSL